MERFWGEVVQTNDGSVTLRHPLYDEDFHTQVGARFETKALYIDGSGFGQAMQAAEPGAVCGVLDVGLGLGYNALMTIETWWLSSGHAALTMLSLEMSPELVGSLRDPLCPWKKDWSPEWRRWAEALAPLDASGRSYLRLVHPRSGQTFEWSIQIGDGTQLDLPAQAFDFIWQDAFSHKKNPELWSVAWFVQLHAASRPGVCLVTYSVARLVKDHVLAAGWDFIKIKASSHKRQWLKASLKTT